MNPAALLIYAFAFLISTLGLIIFTAYVVWLYILIADWRHDD